MFKKTEICGTQGTAILEEEDITKWEFDPELPDDAKIRDEFAQQTNYWWWSFGSKSN